MIDIQSFEQIISSHRNAVNVPNSITDLELIQSYKNAKAIEEVLLPEFNKAESEELIISQEYLDNGINTILSNFKTEVLEILENEEEDFHERHRTGKLLGQNLFEVANTPHLYLSNKYTRVISENLGHKLEDIATLSFKIINPETHFGFKIKGVDVILFSGGQFHFCQLKTKKDTLTGSQKSRSEKELEIHASSKFVACLSLGGWTFNTKKTNIERIQGEEFWNQIDIKYDYLIQKLSSVLREIEDELFGDD